MAVDLRWGERTYVMGIVNVTPDSFSGDGLATNGRGADERLNASLALARRFAAAGAEIIDVGAESSRPRGAYGDHSDVAEAAELELAVPVVRGIVAELGDRVLVSIDTSKGAVARAALEAGARIVNDVWGASRDPGTADAAAASGAYLVVMHNQDGNDYPDGTFDTVAHWLSDAVDAAIRRGVPRDRIIVDPGIGFGKGTGENLELLHRLAELRAALGGLPLLVGTSRKRFLGELLDGAPADDRLEGTAATVALAIASGADIVRVHDVPQMSRVRAVADAVVRR